MSYPSVMETIQVEAKGTDEEIAAVGGIRTLVITNHLIQDEITAQNIANSYLAKYKNPKTRMKIKSIAPLPYEVGDVVGVEI
jgi:hypothetical protein